MSAACAVKLSGGHPCGGALTFVTDAIGRLVPSCARCVRRVAGVCQDCPRRVDGTVGRALRCAACRRAKLRLDGLHWRTRDPEHARAVRRECHRAYRDRKRGGPPTPREERYRRLGHARAAALTPARRREIALKAITTRWARVKAAA